MKEEKKILIVEDDTDINNLLFTALEKQGYTATQAFSGTEAKMLLKMKSFALVLLDLMLPGVPGEEVLKFIREQGNSSVIILTAKDTLDDKVNLLIAGADDYITKPFGMMEFLARVKAVLRRSKKHSSKKEYHYKSLTVNVERHQVFDNDRAVELTLKEFELLRYLVENKGIVLSRDEILEKIWGYECAGETRTVDVHIRTLRQKLGDSGFLIETVRGVGYRIGDSQ